MRNTWNNDDYSCTEFCFAINARLQQYKVRVLGGLGLALGFCVSTQIEVYIIVTTSGLRLEIPLGIGHSSQDGMKATY